MKNTIVALTLLLFATVGMAQNCQRTVFSFIKPAGGYDIAGTATLSKNSDSTLLLEFSSSFSTVAGPDLYVYLAKYNLAPTTSGNTNYSVAPLMSPAGAQSYTVPATVDINEYDFVLIHCNTFNHFWGGGELSTPTGNCGLAGINDPQFKDGPAIYKGIGEGEFFIRSLTNTTGKAQVEVFNAIGKKVYSTKLFLYENRNSLLDLSVLSKGIYIVRIVSEKHQLAQRIIHE